MQTFDLINQANAEYVERLFQQYQQSPGSIDPEWRAFFAGFELGAGGRSPSIVPSVGSTPIEGFHGPLAVEIADLVHSYRELGHFVANLDPLGHNRNNHPLLELSEFGLSLADLDRNVGADGFQGTTNGSLRDLIERLRVTYCSTLGVEFMDISDKTQREWLIQRMEPIFNKPALPAEQRVEMLKQIVCAQGFEEFLGVKYGTAKRFGLEGGEALIPLLNQIVDDGSALGVDEIVFGMAHRGRLNVLAHVLKKPHETILGEFEGKLVADDEGDGDVKYHLGYSADRTAAAGRKIHLALSFNPSHLELVNPVVEGIVRGKQYYLRDDNRTRVVPVLIHGDAAFCGQGIVQETIALSEMPYWRTGGTIHVIINNQVGFTTMPKQGRFTPYPTDVAKMIQAPIFHVNGDDPEACAWAAKLAIAFRQEFHCDVFLDLWCYRRLGHNEQDEPSFTQPLMYHEIAAHTALREIYSKRLIDEGVVTADQVEQMKAEARAQFDKAQSTAREPTMRAPVKMFGGVWQGMTKAPPDMSAVTKVGADVIQRVAGAIRNVPEGFTVHPKLQRLMDARVQMAQGNAPFDWGTAEMMSLGSLLLEGTAVRFVGQDVQRGTFSHRHACLHDYHTGQKYYPLANIAPEQAPVALVNSMLSELAVLGFEYGFASSDPRNLVMWEAQFGDFVNGAQAIIDQFIIAAESKWGKYCGLVMMLPHGYEGAGPEHSYAYLDRFLALSAENNIQVVQSTMPSQHFHVLRRQMKRSFRKPLIMMMPKSLLRHEMSASPLSELTEGAFQLIIDDPTEPNRDKVERVLLCSGKIYFTIHQARQKHNAGNVAIVRVEQLYPFPQKEIAGVLAKYRNATEIAWVQEEPENRGAWTFMERRLRRMLPDGRVLEYFGREEAASPAVGSYKLHQIEEHDIVTRALDLPAPPAANGQANATNGQSAQPPRQSAVEPSTPQPAEAVARPA